MIGPTIRLISILLIPIAVFLLIFMIKKKAEKERLEIEAAAATEEERKREWIQKMKWHRFNTWWRAVMEADEIIAVNSVLPQGFMGLRNETVLLANRDCKLFESCTVYSTDISGGVVTTAESYQFTKEPHKTLMAPNTYMGMISDSTSVTNTIGAFTAVATTRAFQEKQLISTGTLIVTNLRVIFLGNHQNRSYNMEQILACNSDEFYLSLSAEGNDKQMIFETFDAAVFKGMINLVQANYYELKDFHFSVMTLPRELPKLTAKPRKRLVRRK